MIGERQALAILSDCEARMGGELTDLRRRLRDNNPRPGLWELLVLDSVLAAEQVVDHEPHPSCPDIVVGAIDEDRLFFECAWVTPTGFEQQVAVHDFIRFLRLQVRQRSNGIGINLRFEAVDETKPVQVPHKHLWARVAKSNTWNEFVFAAFARQDVRFPVGFNSNLVFYPEGLAKGRYAMTSGPVVNTPSHPTEHPIYQTIRKKARQASEWTKLGYRFDPLVLVIGADEGSSYIDARGGGDVTLRQAIYSALLQEDAPTITRLNSAGSWPSRVPAKQDADRRHFNLYGPRIRVEQSYLIAAVVVVQLQDEIAHFGAPRRRVAKLKVFPNPDPNAAIYQRQMDRIGRCLRLDHVEYSTRRESWECDPRKGESLFAARARLRGGSLRMRGGFRMLDSIDIPAILLHRILAGDISSTEVWRSYNSEAGRQLKEALESGREIVGAEYIDSPARGREEPMVRIRLGPVQSALLRVSKSKEVKKQTT